MATGGLTKEELRDILNENRKSGGGGFDTSSFSGLNSKVKDAGDAFSPFNKGINTAKEAFNDIKQTIDKSVGVWQQLSGSGASFNNDLVGMNVAAAGSRLSLEEFADVIKKNSANMIGLGGSANQGAIMFAKLGKEMFDSGVTDQLKLMGMSGKEVNETLALQLSFQRSTFKDSKEGHAESIRAATQLATEMDAMSKLTGKTRAEQEDAMKKAAADAQVEAKMRLIGIEKGPDAEAKAREIYAKQFNEAQARGQGQMFKEVFATGHVMSQEAANQQALLGEQATATAAQAKATANGDLAAADAYNKQAQAAAMANQKDESKLRLTALGDQGGAASKVYMEQLTANRGLYDAEQKIRQESAFKNASNETVLAEAKRRITLEQAGKDKDGKDIAGAGTTKAVIQLQNRLGDVNSALMSGLVKPLNDTVGPAFNKFASGPLSGTVDRKGAGGKVETVGAGQAYTDTVRKNFEAGASSEGKDKSVKQNIRSNQGEGYFGSDVLASIGGLAGGVTGAGMGMMEKLTNSSIVKAASGTPTDGTSSASTKPSTATDGSTVAKSTLDDVVERLDQLNTNMSNVAAQTENLNDTAGKQVRATRNMSGDRFR